MSERLPQDGFGDDLHRGARMLLSCLPAGGAAVELFNRLLAPPIQRRRDAWLNHLADRVAKFEQEGRVKVEDLQQNDEFISTVMQASQAAVRNHQQEKLGALRNAVLNTALGQAPEDSKREMFLGFVDTLTVWHLRVLSFLSAPGAGTDVQKVNMDLTTGHHAAVIAALQNAFPDLREEGEFVQKIVGDLDREGLILGDVTLRTVRGLEGMRNLTNLGDEFLRFISEPKGG